MDAASQLILWPHRHLAHDSCLVDASLILFLNSETSRGDLPPSRPSPSPLMFVHLGLTEIPQHGPIQPSLRRI